ncbi:MAG: MotA/TolQ/ExbB proton channel family protein [Opitutales bacterium]
MQTLIQGAGAFIWPLGFCSFLALFLIIERALALRVSKVAPESVVKSVLTGQPELVGAADGESVAGRLVQRWKDGASGEVLKAWARHELIRLQRGLHLLDSIVAGAPLLGLLGTVAGLAALFPEQGLPDTVTLTRGVGLALSTTMIGLCVAIPSLLATNWLARRLEIHSSRLDVLVEALEARRR